MKVFEYLRKSRSEENDPDALSKHRQKLEEFAMANDLQIIRIFEEIVSGENLYLRPQMLSLLSEIAQTENTNETAPQAILCMDIDRLGRGDMTSQGIIFETLKRYQVQIITPQRRYDLNDDLDETYTEFEAFMARQEYKMIRRRMTRGTLQAVQNGGHMGEVPFGYQRIRRDKRSTLAPHPVNAPVLQQIFTLYGKHHLGMQAIAGWLDRSGIPPKKGMQWNRGTIGKMLRNPVYLGKIVYGRKRTLKPHTKEESIRYLSRDPAEWITKERCHPPLVDEELFFCVQRRLAERSQPSTAGRQRQNPYSGLLLCANCGQKMQRRHQPAKGIEEQLRCPTAGCSHGLSREAFESALLFALKPYLEAWECVKSKQDQEEESLLPALCQEYDMLRKQRQRLFELLEQGIYDPSVFEERSAELARREALLTENIEKCKENRRESQQRPRAFTLYDLIGAEKDAAKKNELLRCFLSHIEYDSPQSQPLHSPVTLRIVLRDHFL